MSRSSFLGPLAAGLLLLGAGFAFLRKRFLQARASRNLIFVSDDIAGNASEDRSDDITSVNETPVVIHSPEPHVRRSGVEAAPLTAEPATSVTRASLPWVEPSAMPMRTPNTATTVTLAIDAEALERSYLDSLGIDPSASDVLASETSIIDASDYGADGLSDLADTSKQHAVVDTAHDDTVALDALELDTALVEAELNTVVIDAKTIDAATVAKTDLDFNLSDLDATAQHVHMPSDLHDRAVVTERRTSIVDALKMAIDRDPHRRDLRLKLLETYYSAAKTNQRAFMDVVRQLARDSDFLSADDWKKVNLMGREIAADDIMFADHPNGEDLADCA